jgi:transposase
VKIRTTKTSSGAVAVQVVNYLNGKMEVLAHIGSAGNEEDVFKLKRLASDWIHSKSNSQLSFLPQLESKKPLSSLVQIGDCECLGFRYRVFYECFYGIIIKLKLHLLGKNLGLWEEKSIKIINDLIIARIAHPASKLESFEFIFDYFGIKHGRRDFYRVLSELPKLKEDVESKIIAVAKKHFGFNFNLVFYDLTTLYFESKKDEGEDGGIRRIGFSKDNKSSNPQIMIGLLVNDLGFPVSYQLFAGNKFEGHTLMPSINSLRKKYKIKDMTVVADSAMMSEDNFKFLINEKLNYIVAARTANLSPTLIVKISEQLNKEDEKTIRLPTESKGDLVLSFSKKRHDKEKREMDKQLEKANYYLKHPSQAEIIKRTKFLKGKKLGYELNRDLINKTTLLLGIKGYYTNLSEEKLSNEKVIEQYKNLWRVEQNFRISKSDLKSRPIFHNKKQAIETHILICFTVLAIAKYIEIKTKKSIKSIAKTLKKSVDAIIYDPLTKQEFLIKAKTNELVEEILKLI